MKRFIIIAMLTAIMPLAAMAQHEEDTENGVVSLAGREGFTIETKKGDFVFKPYLLVQTSANLNWYDDEGLDKAYNQDNIANSGFSVPYAVLGFTGKAFDKVSFNLSINAAASGGALLQQAWFDVQLKKQFAIRVGKFKTPFSHAYLTTLGETLLPSLPVSLTAPVILPYSLNAVTPNIGTGFDLGVEIHGLVADKFGYEIGLFNGTGAAVNTATKTFSDDWHIPSLLYAGRFTYMPKGVMPATQGNPNRLNEDKIMFGISTSINVESENESTNDYRAGLEFAMLKNKLYLGAEVYYMNVGFTKRQKISESYNYLGGYVQGGYFVAPRLQAAARYDFFNRNGMDTNGFLNMPAVGMNYFFKNCNLKLQAMYQYIARKGHDTQLDRDNDDSEEGRTLKMSGKINGISKWPDGYSVVVAGFNDESEYAVVTKTIPAVEDDEIQVTMTGVSDKVTTIELCVINKLRKRVISFQSMDDLTAVDDTILMDVGTVNVGMYHGIQEKVFNTTCAHCHGGSSSAAANLYLTEGKSYEALVNRPSKKVDGMLLVKPGSAQESVLHTLLNTTISSTWGYDHSKEIVSSPILTLIDDWINNGAQE